MDINKIYEKLSENLDYANAHWAAFPVFAIGFFLGHILGGADMTVPFILVVVVFILTSKNNVDRRHRKVVQAKLDEIARQVHSLGDRESPVDLVGLENATERTIDDVKQGMLAP